MKLNRKPKIIIMSGYGLNCEEETKFAFEKAGGQADIVHLNDLIASPAILKEYDILAFPGGFAYGDDTGSGKAYANKFKNHLSKELSVPIAHGEGQYTISAKDYKNLKKNKQIAFTYTKGNICKFQNLKANPNGSMHDIAGVLAYNGRVLGLMPHPERAMFSHQSPMWQKNKKMITSEWGDGILIFKNAINYFRNKN